MRFVIQYFLSLYFIITALPAFTKPLSPSIPPAKGLALQLSRIDYALQSITRLKTDWPWLASDETCIVLTDRYAQYLLNCEAPPHSPYDKTPWRFHGRPIYINSSEAAVLDTQSAPYKVFSQQLVGTVVVYQPQHPKTTGFAKQKPWIFVTSLEALIENHPAFDEKTTTEAWLSIFIHEFFHTRQLLHPNAQKAWGHILAGEINPGHLDALYLNNPDYRAAVDQEYAYLVKAVEQPSNAHLAQAALKHWLALRQQRIEGFRSVYSASIPSDPSDAGQLEIDDTTYLYIEGVARYVENVFTVKATLQAPTDLLAQDPRFTAFSHSVGQGYQGMWSRKIPHGGKYYYALGLHVGLLLDRVNPAWTHTVHEKPQGLIDSVKEALSVPIKR
jgi:hypothetical protein